MGYSQLEITQKTNYAISSQFRDELFNIKVMYFELKSDVVGVFTPVKLANATNQGLFWKPVVKHFPGPQCL